MKDNLDAVKGIGIALILGAIVWFCLIWGGMYVWKTYLKPTENKISRAFEIKEVTWTHLRYR